MSKPAKTINQIAHERLLAFNDSLGKDDYIEDGIILAVQNMAALCRVIFGEEVADAGFETMVRRIVPNRPEKETWDQILEEEPAAMFFETPFGQLMHDLKAYADFGIVLNPARDADQRKQQLNNQIYKAIDLLQYLPVKKWGLETEHMYGVIEKTIIRSKLDAGQSIDARELAILSGRALQTIRNYVAGTPSVIPGNQNRIEAKDAENWLRRQKDFHMSIWRQQDDAETIESLDLGLGKVLFLPVARDGSVFHPGVRRHGKYVVDAEGRERELETFDEALQTLQSMYFPEWRRPTSEGVWTRVRAVEWRRYGEKDVASMVEEHRRKHPGDSNPDS